MYPSKTLLKMQLIQNHTTLAAVKGWFSRNTSRKRTFTVFAPTNAAFAKLPMGTVETLLKPENLKRYKRFLLTTLCQVK
jgi:hypothetical protein